MKRRNGIPESSLLLTLEEISNLVSHSHEAAETLNNIVHLIQKRFGTDVCSVYLWEPGPTRLVLSATVGLRPDSVGRVAMGLHEGLTGLVGEQMTPVMVEDAFAHPRFKYFPEAAEDRFHSFLGVPIVERGLLQGVLVVQTVDRREFSRDESRMLVTVASQLASLVSGSRLLEDATAAARPAVGSSSNGECPGSADTHAGVSLSPGVGQGEAYLIDDFEESEEEPGAFLGTETEIERLNAAVSGAREELARLGERLSDLLGEEHGVILQGQLMILQDRRIEEDVRSQIAGGATAEQALRRTLETYRGVFQKLTNQYFQERIYDIRDAFRRVLWQLRPVSSRSVDRSPAGGAKLVLVAHEASVLDLFAIEPEQIAAVVVEHGGPQSHAAILARSLKIPMVGGVRFERAAIRPGLPLRVDGDAGEVCFTLRPTNGEVPPGGNPLRPHLEIRSANPGPDAKRTLPPAEISLPRLEANLNLPFEVEEAISAGAEGVGLFRSEFLFLARRTLPTEEEQVATYSRLVRALKGRPISIRTFDLRPDKLAHWSRFGTTDHRRLDWRLVLETPPVQKLFRDQVRAILRAAVAGPTRLLVPFVNSSEQLEFIVSTVERAREELHRDGWEYAPDVTLGITLESAAAAEMVRTWAPHVDFFALGTNDLVASTLALERDDVATQRLHDPLHPGVLRLIHSTVTAAHYAGRPVTVCGEMAGTSAGAKVLAALQVDSLSVAVHRLAEVREALCECRSDWKAMAPQLVCARSATEVRELVQQQLRGIAATS